VISPKELDALLKVARKHNVASLEVDGLKVSLLPQEPAPEPTTSSVPTAELTDEEIQMWSSGSPL
jgi:hypothetical protein